MEVSPLSAMHFVLAGQQKLAGTFALVHCVKPGAPHVSFGGVWRGSRERRAGPAARAGAVVVDMASSASGMWFFIVNNLE